MKKSVVLNAPELPKPPQKVHLYPKSYFLDKNNSFPGIVYLPDRMDADPPEDDLEQLWRVTNSNLRLLLGEPIILEGKKFFCTDKSKYLQMYAPFGVYDVDALVKSFGCDVIGREAHPELMIKIQASEANVIENVYKKLYEMKIPVAADYHTGIGKPAFPIEFVEHCKIKHYHGYFTMRNLQDALAKMNPFRDVRVYANVCRVYWDEEDVKIPMTMHQYDSIDAGNMSFKYKKDLQTKQKEIHHLTQQMQSGLLSPADFQKCQKQIEKKTKEIQKIREIMKVETAAADLSDMMSILDIEEDTATSTRKKRKKPKRKKRSRTRGVKSKRKSKSKKQTDKNK